MHRMWHRQHGQPLREVWPGCPDCQRLKNAICNYFREELGNVSFESDDEIVEHVLSYDEE